MIPRSLHAVDPVGQTAYYAELAELLGIVVRGAVVVANHLVDDEAKELLAKRWVESGRVSHGAEPSNLYRFTVGVSRCKADLSFVLTHALGDLESFGEQMNERGIDVVDAGAAFSEHVVVVHGKNRSPRYLCSNEWARSK